MKKIGLIGGLSHESTLHYYDGISKGMKARLGGLNNGRVQIASMNFQDIATLQKQEDWDRMGEMLAAEAKILEDAGADFIVLATNTMHRCTAEIEAAISIPFLHIGDATAKRILSAGFNKVALLGTSYTMQMDFYKGRLEAQGIEVLVPSEEDMTEVHRIIYGELCHGVVNPDSKAKYSSIIEGLERQGAQGVILGCTEIQMLLQQRDLNLPVFDTTQIHIEEALEAALS